MRAAGLIRPRSFAARKKSSAADLPWHRQQNQRSAARLDPHDRWNRHGVNRTNKGDLGKSGPGVRR